MSIININFFVETLGWTLLHSLWQGLVIGLMLLLIRKMVPGTATWQYATHAGALLTILLTTAGTFCYLAGSSSGFQHGLPQWMPAGTSLPAISGDGGGASVGQGVRLWISQHLYEIVFAWSIGAVVLSLRLLMAWWYSWQLKRGGLLPEGHWKDLLGQLASTLGVTRKVVILQSALLNSPVLLGYLKPVILVPIGMLSGLSTRQVEAILLHELAHIRRHDYLVNVFQSVMEVVFFFNPVVWGISSRVRSEREKCCDDIVVGFRDPLTYAQALHRLEEARVGHASLALAAISEKNQLLHRIKRIMETSEKKAAGKGKMFPAIIMLLVLTGASWLSIQAYFPPRPRTGLNHLSKHDPITADTSKKDRAKAKQEKAATLDAPSPPQDPETVAPENEEEEKLILMPDFSPFNFSIAPVPALPDFDFAIPEIAAIPEIEWRDSILSPMNLRFNFSDTVPPFQLEFRNNWEGFEEQFREQFREKFSDFYKDHQAELDNMMKELSRNLESVARDRRDAAEEIARAQEQLSRTMSGEQAERALARAKEQLDAVRPRQQQKIDENLRRAEQRLQLQQEQLASQMSRQKRAADAMVATRAAFEEKFADQLRRDGYLGKDEKINDLRFQEGDLMEVNGKKIRDQDRLKYRALRQQPRVRTDRPRRSE
jgi:bla regulator protein BlaR1